jgi:DNA-binding response OmpR family regulator
MLPARKPTVLVVDAEDDTRETLRFLLDADGFETAAARDAGAGASCLEQINRPTVVLLDGGPHGELAREFLARMRDLPHLVDVPVVVMSSQPTLAPDSLPSRLGGFFPKPVDIDAVLRSVRDWNARETGMVFAGDAA